MKSKIISLSAISAGFTAISLLVGAYFEFADLFCLVVASSFIILPLYLRSYLGSILASLVGGVIAFLCSGLNIMSLVFPAYFAFFGIYPIVKLKMLEKNINKYFSLAIGLVWFIIVGYAMYFYYTLIMSGVFDGIPTWLIDYLIYLVGLLSAIVFIVYDRFIFVVKLFTDRYLRKFIK